MSTLLTVYIPILYPNLTNTLPRLMPLDTGSVQSVFLLFGWIQHGNVEL